MKYDDFPLFIMGYAAIKICAKLSLQPPSGVVGGSGGLLVESGHRYPTVFSVVSLLPFTAYTSDEQRVLDVAFNYGVSSHANFTRTFKETYGITPEEYKKTRPMMNTVIKPNDFIRKELPAGDYIVCKIEAENFENLVTEALDKADKYLFGTWLPNHQLTTKPFSVEKYAKTLVIPDEQCGFWPKDFNKLDY